MDNLLLDTARFLFVPEAALSVIFLIVFAALFALGIYWTMNCRKTVNFWQEHGGDEYEKVRDKMPAELFVRKLIDKNSAEEAKPEGLPDVFVSVGIIGTFLGLGVAIQGAADLLQDEKIDLTKLTAVLGIIAFKFQTSVWGIAFSLVFRRFVVEPYMDLRQRALDFLRETVYAEERAGVRALLEEQNALLSEHFARSAEEHRDRMRENEARFNMLFDLMRALSRAREDFLEERLSDFKTSRQEMHAENLAALSKIHSENLDKLAELRNDFDGQLATQRELVARQAQILAEKLDFINNRADERHERNLQVAAQVTDALQNFSATAEVFGNDARNFTQTTGKFVVDVDKFKADLTEFFREEFDRLQKTNSDFVARQGEYIERLRERQENYLDELGKRQSDNIARIQDEQLANMHGLTNGLDELHLKFYNDSRQFVADTQKLFADKVAQVLDEVHEKYSEEARKVAENAAEANRILAEVSRKTQEVNQKALNVQESFARRQMESATKFNATTEKLSARVEEAVATAAAQTANFQAQAKNFVEEWQTAAELSGSLRKVEYELAQCLKDLRAEFAALKASNDADREKVVASFGESVQDLTKKLDGVEEVKAKLDGLKIDLDNQEAIALTINQSLQDLSKKFDDKAEPATLKESKPQKPLIPPPAQPVRTSQATAKSAENKLDREMLKFLISGTTRKPAGDDARKVDNRP